MFSLPWPPARSLRLGERDVFEPAGLFCYGAAPPDQLGNQSKPGLGQRFQGQQFRCLTPDTRNLKPIKQAANLLKAKLKYKLVHFAHNWNNGMLELWNDGFKKNKTQIIALVFLL